MVTLWASIQCIWPTYQHVVTAVILFVTVFTILTSKHNTGVCIYIYIYYIYIYIYIYIRVLVVRACVCVYLCNTFAYTTSIKYSTV